MLIVAVSYDTESLNQRMRAFEAAGHVVVPASSLARCLQTINTDSYHLLVIGATVGDEDRKTLINESRRVRPQAFVISVQKPASSFPEGANVSVPAGDEQIVLEAVRRLRSQV